MKRTTRLYMAVTADELELPLFVTGSVEELAAWYGVTRATIRSSISRGDSGKKRGVRFVKVTYRRKRKGGAE